MVKVVGQGHKVTNASTYYWKKVTKEMFVYGNNAPLPTVATFNVQTLTFVPLNFLTLIRGLIYTKMWQIMITIVLYPNKVSRLLEQKIVTFDLSLVTLINLEQLSRLLLTETTEQ